VHFGERQAGPILATFWRKKMLVPVPIDIARADEPLELFWRQLLARGLPFRRRRKATGPVAVSNGIVATTGRGDQSRQKSLNRFGAKAV
jgi:hypothetical protein